jgi:hypothetical protein
MGSSAVMKLLLPILTITLFAAACSKQSASPQALGAGDQASVKSAAAAPDTSWVTVQVNGTAITVTALNFSRCSSTFNFSAGNSLQRLDAYCFYFAGSSGLNYQYSDSINYSTRPDTLTPWTTITAANSAEVSFACCAVPVADSIIDGSYQAPFYLGKTSGLTITGNFHAVFQ